MLDSGRGRRRLEKTRDFGFLKGIFKNKGCRGFSQQLLATIGCLGSSRTKITREHALKSSVRILRDPGYKG